MIFHSLPALCFFMIWNMKQDNNTSIRNLIIKFEKGENVSLTKLDSIFTKLQFTIIIRIV